MSGAATKRELHLHVGLPKTGTTYLQQCLALNKEWFAAQGIAMGPRQDRNGAHHDLAWLFRDSGPEALAEELRSAPGRRLLVSSEVFGDLLPLGDAAVRLQAAMAPHFDVTVHITLRRQDFLKESAFAEVVKLDLRAAPPQAEPDPAFAGQLRLWDDPDLDRRLTILENAFGYDALRVSVHRDRAARDPVDRLCRELDLDGTPPRRPEGYGNESLPRRKTLFLSHVAKGDRDLAVEVLATVHASRRIATDASKFLLSPMQRRAVLQRYLEGNRRIVTRHAPQDGDWLLELPAEDPDWFPAAPIRRSEFLVVGAGLVWRALRDRRLPTLVRFRRAEALAALIFDAMRHARRGSAST